jgi:hypothetical protein
MFSILSFQQHCCQLADKQLHVDRKNKRLFVVSSKWRQISVQFSHFEHQFVILPNHIGRTPCEGSFHDDTQVKVEVTHRSTMTRLTGRQRQWLTIPATSMMMHRSTHPLLGVSPLKLDMFSTRSSDLLCHRDSCGACNSPTQQCLA